MNKILYKKNVVTIYFEDNQTRKGKQNFKKSVIESSSTILSKSLLNYIKKGGDINNLTPNELYKKN